MSFNKEIKSIVVERALTLAFDDLYDVFEGLGLKKFMRAEFTAHDGKKFVLLVERVDDRKLRYSTPEQLNPKQ